MRPTVETALPGGVVKTDDQVGFERFVNRELLPVAKKARDVLNFKGTEKVGPTDSDGVGTSTTIWTSPTLPADATLQIEADIVGVGVGNVHRALFKVARCYQMVAGVLTMSPSAELFVSRTSNSIDAGLTATGSDVARVFVDDNSVGVLRWTAIVRVTELSEDP